MNQSITPELKYLDHDKPALTDAQWQEKAQWFVGICQEKLFSREGEDALQYLHQRGLSSATIEQYSLGYCSSSHHQNWGNTKGIYLPCGIVIPSWIDGQIRTVKFRVPEGEPKYIAATGGAGGLYMADNLQLGCTVIMAEGEFDAHILAEHVQIDGVAPIATGGSNNNQTMDAVVELMALADQILLAFDQDEAGVNAALWWQNELGDKASIMQLSHHDVTDMYLAGIDLNQWVQDALG